jgi:phosphate starvation-inducible PhoH-like protein
MEGVDEVSLRRFKTTVDRLITVVREGDTPSPEYVRALVKGFSSGTVPDDPAAQTPVLQGPGSRDEPPPWQEAIIRIPHGFSRVFPRSRNQGAYVLGMRACDICFGIGPAGTGKTFLAIAEALRLVLSKTMRKLVLTRPVVEAGESLGFLPGDLNQKINPYLRPLYDAMESLVPYDLIRRMEENRAIEIAPLAYMRGRSLNDCIVVLDEAQNTTKEQMKMFLTRIGEGARAVVTGDTTQIDLPRRGDSGLIHAVSILSGIEGIHFSFLHTQDVVRNPLIKKIIAAYEQARPEGGPKGAQYCEKNP